MLGLKHHSDVIHRRYFVCSVPSFCMFISSCIPFLFSQILSIYIIVIWYLYPVYHRSPISLLLSLILYLFRFCFLYFSYSFFLSTFFHFFHSYRALRQFHQLFVHQDMYFFLQLLALVCRTESCMPLSASLS